MPKAWSEDLRRRVVEAYRGGESVTDVCTQFKVHRNCVYRWDEQDREEGTLTPRYDRCTGRKSKVTVDAKFEAFAAAHAHSTLQQMADHWEGEVSQMTMSRSTRKLGWTRKKRPMPTRSVTKKSA